MSSVAAAEKPHAICIPFPIQSHINCMLKLSKLLHHRGFHITFVNTEFNHRRILKSRGPNALKGLLTFHFETIPDGLPPSNANATQDIPALCESTRNNCIVPFRSLVAELNNTSSSNAPPVTCLVSDGLMSFTLGVAQELGIPQVFFWTISFCAFTGVLHYSHLIRRGLIPFKDDGYLTNGYLETPIDWIPGMKDIRLMDLPTFLRTTDPKDIMLNFCMGEAERTHKASALIFNTFDALECDVLDATQSQFPLPPIHTIGPVQLLLSQMSENESKSIGSNLWKEELECLEWLDSKDPNSVVYVNFGSIAVPTPQQLIEIAWGLANSKHAFLWIIRPDVFVGDSTILWSDFLTETKDRCMLASWCAQEQVLYHPSIGGFITHSGWNSTMESVCGGVPMICLPFFADQQTNCRYCCIHWGIGMEIDSYVRRDEVECLVRELMEGVKGKDMKMKAMEWKKRAEEAAAPEMTYATLTLLVQNLRCCLDLGVRSTFLLWGVRSTLPS